MCDYSLNHLLSRPAKVGDELETKNFGATTGFRAAGCGNDLNAEAATVICVLPGTEIAFKDRIAVKSGFFLPLKTKHKKFAVARFIQVRKDEPHVHHDALELPTGEIVMLNDLVEGQFATVLQMPAAPKTDKEVEEQKRAEFV